MNNDTIGQNLKRIIKNKETTMTKVANACGVSLQAIRLVAIDQNKPSRDLLEKMAKYLGVYDMEILGANSLGRNADRESKAEGIKMIQREEGNLNSAESGHVSLVDMIEVSGKPMESKILYMKTIANWTKKDRTAFQNWLTLVKRNHRKS